MWIYIVKNPGKTYSSFLFLFEIIKKSVVRKTKNTVFICQSHGNCILILRILTYCAKTCPDSLIKLVH